MGFKQKSATIAEIFAENLRRECQSFASIAEFCRKARINRQQFNRYLAGQNLPNPASLKKICAALGIAELELFVSSDRRELTRTRSAASFPEGLGLLLPKLPPLTLAALSQAASNLVGQGNAKGALLSGAYLAYMPMAGLPGQIICTALKISQRGGITIFTRRTSFRSSGETRADYTVGKHLGLVLSDVAATTFIGVNKIFPHEMSVMRIIHSVVSAGTANLGLSVVRSPIGELACKVVLVSQGTGPAAERQALSRIGVFRMGDPALPAVVSQHLSNQVMPDAQAHDYVAVNELLQFHQHLTPRPAARG